MTDRRDFLKNTVLTSTGLLVLPLLSFDEKKPKDPAEGELEKNFLHPPAQARPQAFWMWMNGHVTKKGISLDLEAMKEMGLAGVFLFNTNIGIPKGPVEYGSPQWRNLFLHALKEAERLGLELFFHNSPGFSSTGGAKVSPELSMQQLVWSEMMVKGGSLINQKLPQPFTKLGYYRDAMVVAFPSLPVERKSMMNHIVQLTVNGEERDKSLLQATNPNNFLLLEPSYDGQAILQLRFDEPFEARAVSITRPPEPPQSVYDPAYDHPPMVVLESSEDGTIFKTVCNVPMPLIRYIDAPGTQSFPAVTALYFRLLFSCKTRLTGFSLHGSPRLAGWPGKLNFTETDLHPNNQDIDDSLCIDPKSVVDLAKNLQSDGRLVWNVPKGDWTILRIGHTCTGTRNVASPDGAEGLEIDKFSKEAVAAYFRLYLDALIKEAKGFIPTTLKGILVDSYEVGKQNWTADLPIEFEQRRGYNMASFAPALTGRIVESISSTEIFLHDVRSTAADLVAENYYGAFHKRCAAQGLRFYAQPNGDGVFDSLQVGQYLDAGLSEFWVRNVPGTLNVCKQAVSIAHGYGRKTVAAEAFTGMPRTSRWTEYPFSLKSQGDYLYSFGINRFVLHLFVHQPYTTGFPGMTMGPYGTHFDRNNTWRKAAKAWVHYLTRTQYILQQGLPVADVLYFKGEEPASGIPDVNYVNPPVPKTLNGDVIGPDVLLNRISILNNIIVLPNGMQYRLLILAPLQNISLPVLQKLKSLVAAGMRLIVTTKPTDLPGRATEKNTSALMTLVAELWGDLDGKKLIERSFGNGRLYWNKPLADILQENNIKPDFEFTSDNSDAAIHYTHRRIDDADVYFVSNHLRRRESIVCTFRTAGKQPEIWNAETGEIFNATLYAFEGGRTRVPLAMEPAGSLFIVFRKKTKDFAYHTLLFNDSVLLSANNFSVKSNGADYPTVTNNFTVLLWAKPDVPADHPKGVLIFPPEGEIVYGNGHAACGLSAGQNGIRIFEREKGANHSARGVLNCLQSLEGWTHLALRYQEGAPSLFVNGRLVCVAKASGKIVHPGLGTTPTDEFFSAAFEGNSTKPLLVAEALSNDAVAKFFQQGLPPTENPFPATLSETRQGTLKVLLWQNGRYEIKSDKETKTITATKCEIIPLEALWQVRFPPASGAPTVPLEKLISLHRHSHFDVKHFSGTATYQAEFLFSKKMFEGRRVLLDLGRVEVVAEVILNEKVLGTVWKEPYCLDATKAIRLGKNTLIVRVSNLWPNRMIGDTYLPEEISRDENGFAAKFPDWYLQNKPKPGGRKTFSAWNDFKKTDPLLESGLLGPVRLVLGVENILT